MATKNSTPTEMETFLPKDQTANGTTKYKVTKVNDVEAVSPLSGDFDPFKVRVVEHPVSDCGTLTHLLKASLGTGILSMPVAFQNCGLVMGIFATMVVSTICTHCSYILVSSAHELYKKSGKTEMTFADVAEEACRRGPKWGRSFAPWARQLVLIGMFVTYFTTCSCYAVIIAKNFESVIEYHAQAGLNERVYIAALLLPLVLLVWVPNLKYLAPFSMVANAFMAIGLGITIYYLVIDIPPITDREYVADISQFPIFFSITVFAVEAIGVVMPLENNMEKPRHFIGLCGVLNQGMSGVTLVYILVGFLGYLRYGDDVQGSITLNLPQESYAAQVVKVLIGLAVFCTFGLQFYVCLEIGWNGLKERFQSRPLLANYTIRTVMVVVCVLLAVAVPAITPFVALIGAFFFSILGLMVPVYIEMVTFWDKGFGRFYWKILKNLVVVVAAIMALIFGSQSAVIDIVKLYQSPEVNATAVFQNITTLNPDV